VIALIAAALLCAAFLVTDAGVAAAAPTGMWM
jgi:hypothetical protein